MTKLIRLSLTLLFCFFVTACDKLIPADSSAASSEVLRAQPPDGWQLIYQLNEVSTRLSDYIPADQSKADWTTKLSFESHKQLVDVDPITILLGEVKKTSELCQNTRNYNLFSGLENDYPTSVRMIMCGENAYSSKGEVSITKAIQGNDYFYIIRLIKRVPSFAKDVEPDFPESEIAEWSSYLKRITLCDNSKPEHPCQPKAIADSP